MSEDKYSTYMYDSATLKEKQSWSYERKVNVTISRILEFCMLNDNNVCVAFSGGADSTVLLDMVCKVWAVLLENPCPLTVIYSNTSNEFAVMPNHAEKVVKLMREKYKIDIDYRPVRGQKSFVDVVKTEGYPVVSKKTARMVRDCRNFFKRSNIRFEDIEDKIDDGIKSAEYLRSLGLPNGVICYLTGITKTNNKCASWRIAKKWRKLIVAPFDVTEKCCDILKKEPMKLIQKETNGGVFIGTMAVDSDTRKEAYQKTGCIVFNDKVKKCMPMGYWLEQDKMRYLVDNKLPVAPVYGEIKLNDKNEYYFTGEQHTGCKLCLFGCHLEKGENNRIQRLKDIEPATYKFAMKPLCDGGLGFKEVMDYIGIESEQKNVN